MNFTKENESQEFCSNRIDSFVVLEVSYVEDTRLYGSICLEKKKIFINWYFIDDNKVGI